MKRTKQWWNQLSPEERVELCALEKASNQLGFRGGGLPDDCSSCTFCGSPHLGVGLCIHCGNTLSRLIRKANNGNEILVLRSRVVLLEAELRKLEWSMEWYGHDINYCPECGEYESKGHRASCSLGAALAGG